VLVVSIISSFGTVQIAANGVANNLDSVGVLIGGAINLAMITVIGQCVGAGDEKQIRSYTKKLLLIAYIPTIILNLVLFLNLGWILDLYGLSPETTSLARTLIFIHNGCACLLWPLSFTFPNMLRACNDVRYTMVVSIASMFIFRIGFSYLIGANLGYGAIGVWIAMVLDWICRVICFLVRYRRGKWRVLAGLADLS
jgi:Na+-driven multidrug efflux pump